MSRIVLAALLCACVFACDKSSSNPEPNNEFSKVRPGGGASAAGSATAPAAKRAHQGFDGISISGAVGLAITQGASFAVELDGDAADIEKTITEVVDSTLHIRCEKSRNGCREIRAKVTLPKIGRLALAGSGAVTATSTLRGDSISISSAGAGDVAFELEVKTVVLSTSGSATANLSGTVDDLNAELSGSGKLVAAKLEAGNAKVRISGAGNAELNVSGELDVVINGAGHVTYSGDATVRKKINGAGSITKR